MMKFKPTVILLISLFLIVLTVQVGFAQQLEPPPAEPSQWTGLIGTYSLSSQDGNTFYLRENQDRLEILFPLADTHRKTESLVFQGKTFEIIPLKEIDSDTFQLPPVNELGARKFRILRDQDGFGAVSYTHLDVYKRQALKKSLFLPEIQCFIKEKPGGLSFKKEKIFIPGGNHLP